MQKLLLATAVLVTCACGSRIPECGAPEVQSVIQQIRKEAGEEQFADPKGMDANTLATVQFRQQFFGTLSPLVLGKFKGFEPTVTLSAVTMTGEDKLVRNCAGEVSVSGKLHLTFKAPVPLTASDSAAGQIMSFAVKDTTVAIAQKGSYSWEVRLTDDKKSVVVRMKPSE